MKRSRMAQVKIFFAKPCSSPTTTHITSANWYSCNVLSERGRADGRRIFSRLREFRLHAGPVPVSENRVDRRMAFFSGKGEHRDHVDRENRGDALRTCFIHAGAGLTEDHELHPFSSLVAERTQCPGHRP